MLLHASASLPRTQRASDSGTLRLSFRFCNFLQLFRPALQTQLARERTLALCRPMREGDDERSCHFSLEGCQSRRCPPSSAADNAAAADAHHRGDGCTWRHARYRLFKPALADTRGSFAPVPVPGGTPLLGGSFHAFAPGPPQLNIDPVDAEPITITNFNGFVGLSYTDGMATRTNTQTGETLRLPFLSSDMRFMQGEFRGADGRLHHGTFALV
jgi:hypothetical protein